MFFLSTTLSTGESKNSQSIFGNKLLLRSEVKILFQSWVRLQIWETMPNSWYLCNTVHVNPLNWKWKKIVAVFGVKCICRRGKNCFMLHSSNLSWAPCYVSPSSINMSLLTVARKHLTGCKALLRRQSCRFIVKWIALLNSRS